jgi:voltage-gated potassium channel
METEEKSSDTKPASNSLRAAIQFYLIDCKTLPGKLIDFAIIILNLVVCVIFVIDTYPISAAMRSTLWTIELVAVCLFIVEYAARFYGSRNRLRYLVDKYSIIDLIAILPTLSLIIFPNSMLNFGVLRIIRVFRVFRIFRFLRFTADPHFFFATTTMGVLRVIRLFLVILIIFFVSSGLFFYVENQWNPNVNTFGDAFYYTIVTLTTVGFGDITPVSSAGKWVTILMIVSGIIAIPWQASQIIKEWIRMSDKMNIICNNCGLKHHDKDASHCKACGHIIYQEYDGN